nr:unnamed protein product [Callosobruchus analis]
MASVSSKVHECTKCTYKTVSTSLLRRHMVNHRDVAGNRKTNRCIYCNNTFARKLTLDDHIVKIHPDFIASVNSKVHDCSKCMYKTVRASHLKRHIVAKHSDTANQCIYCNKTFTRKPSLDDHIVKIHPDFVTSVSSKVHECTECTYKTVSTSLLRRHNTVNHPDAADRCMYCNKTFRSTQSLDDHIVRIHPDFITSVSRKVHECTGCTYKTVSTYLLRRHNMVNHPDAGTCLYCNKTLSTKPLLDDHVVKRHPDFVASVSRKIHECTKCTYKTTRSKCIREHLLAKHSEIANRCIYCNMTFTSTQSLDDHILKIHPDFITSVSSKVHQCTECTYKTIRISHFKRHIVAKHTDVADRCIYCNKTFKSTRSLDNHIVKKHPDFITSISSKVHECTECTYKTASTTMLKKHIVRHSDKVQRCVYCNSTFTRKVTLDDHIVKRHPDFIATISSKVHECTECTFKTVSTSQLKRHIVAGNRKTNKCIYCNKTFKSTQSLDDHVVKIHPDFITSVSSKVHECTECTYKSVSTTLLKQHDISGTSATNRCIYCNKTFKRKRSLDDHIVKIHPDFITSVSRKVHECTECAYKTVSAYLLRRHNMVSHSDVADRCIYCNKTLSRKTSLHDHIVKRHPDFIASVSCKVHECTKCTYKTIRSIELKKHMMEKHPDIAGNRTTSRCIYCNKTFKTTRSLDDHIVKIHPDFITSVSSKVHECKECTYRTVSTTLLKQHVTAKHPDIAGNRKTNRCIYCNKTFKSTQSLNDHIVKMHPDFITSVNSKVHECTECTYKSVSTTLLKHHVTAKHPDIAGNRR